MSTRSSPPRALIESQPRVPSIWSARSLPRIRLPCASGQRRGIGGTRRPGRGSRVCRASRSPGATSVPGRRGDHRVPIGAGRARPRRSPRHPPPDAGPVVRVGVDRDLEGHVRASRSPARTGSARGGGGKLGVRYQRTSSPWWTLSWLPETCAPTWFRFTYQKLEPWDSNPPIPQTPRPNPWSSNASVTESGRSAGSLRERVAHRTERGGAGDRDAVAAPPGSLAEALRTRVGLDPNRSRVLTELGERLAGGVDDAQVDAPVSPWRRCDASSARHASGRGARASRAGIQV